MKGFMRGYGAELGMILFVLLMIIIFAIVFWCMKPYYTPDDVSWVIADKYYQFVQGVAAVPLGVIPSKYKYFIDIERTDRNGILQTETLELNKEEWGQCKIGETCMYPDPEGIVTNWDHLLSTLKEAFDPA